MEQRVSKTAMTAAILMLASSVYAAPYLCRNNSATYQVKAHCDTACGVACEELDPLASGSSGTCDTTNYEGFVYYNNITYAISKSTKFWTDVSNLAKPTDEGINGVLKGIASYYGGNGWIGVYDPTKSNSYNSVDPDRFKLSGGVDLAYSNWAGGQPDNRLDSADIGVTAINGEHWAYIQSNGGWADDGYHKSYGGDYKPKREAIAEWSGPLNCVNGTPKPTTTNTTGYWCGDGNGNLEQCAYGTDYTAKTGSSYSYAATASTTFGSDSCQGGSLQYFSASNYCSSKGMRLPTKAETVAGGGTVPSCSGYTWTSTYNYFSYSGVAYYWVWSGGGLTVRDAYDGDGNQASPSLVRCVGNVTTNTCPNGGTLSGSTCTVNTLACPTGYTATTGAETANGECKKTVGPTCPLGDYQCVDVTGGVENTDTIEGSNDKTDNGETDASGNCLGQIYIFNGGDNRCRPSGIQTGFTDCCRKGTTWFGLGQCRESEKALGKLREFGSLDGNCHYIGDYCAEKWPLIGCVQKKKTYCCFSSPLARIIHEDGRPQLGIGWGSPESPQCRGFTPEEFQKIDFSKVDFSEWVNLQVIPNVQNGAIGNIQNVINNIDTNLAP